MSIRQQMPGQVSVRLLFPQVNPRFELPGMSDEVEHPAGSSGGGVRSPTDQNWAPRIGRGRLTVAGRALIVSGPC